MAPAFDFKCLICGKERDCSDNGLILKGMYICCSCERQMINTPCDHWLYNFYVSGLKKIWRCTVA